MNEAVAASGLRKIGVVGAGQMGGGIANVCAAAGYAVAMVDISDDRIAAARAGIARHYDRQIARGRMTEDERRGALGRLSGGTGPEILSDCDLVIEAATEDESVKRTIFGELVGALRKDALLASNTSSLSITRLAAATDRPERFVGMHFMNPVPAMRLVELIRGITTGEEVFEAVRSLALALGKSPVAAEDYPAFLVNRILLPMLNEAVYALHEGVGSVEAIDTAMKLGANHPMGPLELADFIGLDTCLAVMRVLHDGFADSKYRPCPLLVKYVEAGWLGRKTGRGFYDYSGRDPVPTRPGRG